MWVTFYHRILFANVSFFSDNMSKKTMERYFSHTKTIIIMRSLMRLIHFLTERFQDDLAFTLDLLNILMLTHI